MSLLDSYKGGTVNRRMLINKDIKMEKNIYTSKESVG